MLIHNLPKKLCAGKIPAHSFLGNVFIRRHECIDQGSKTTVGLSSERSCMLLILITMCFLASDGIKKSRSGLENEF